MAFHGLVEPLSTNARPLTGSRDRGVLRGDGIKRDAQFRGHAGGAAGRDFDDVVHGPMVRQSAQDRYARLGV